MSTPDISDAQWIKSSHSGGNEGQCVEFTRSLVGTGLIPVRDSKKPRRTTLLFPTPSWTDFLTALREESLRP